MTRTRKITTIITLAITLALWLALPAPASASPRCRTASCVERVWQHRCSQSRPRACTERAIRTYGLQGWQAAWMRRIPGCESGWNPYAYNGHPQNSAPTAAIYGPPEKSAGLYQFMPSTWATTPYIRRGRAAIWVAKWQALAAAWMLRQGRAGEWVCR